MNSHLDGDAMNAAFPQNTMRGPELQKQWLDSLKQKAEQIRNLGKSKITGGTEGEPVIAEWKNDGVTVRQLPPDEHGILRISVGGGETPVPLNYLVFRGDQGKCVDLLRKALMALEHGPE